MAEISLGSVLDGVTIALHTAFPNSKIYCNTVKSGLCDGDIQVIALVASSDGEPAGRDKTIASISVCYYPSFDGGLDECIFAGEKMKNALGMIKTPGGDILCGLSPNLDIGNGERPIILTIKYTYFSRDMSEEDPIGEFSIKFGGINNG